MAFSAQDLINKGYGGYAGWGDAEANADFAATGGGGKETSGGGGGGSSGGGGVDWGEFQRRQDEDRQRQQDLLKQQEERETGFITDFTTGMATATAGIEADLGLPALRDRARQLSETLIGIPAAVETIGRQVGMSAPRMELRAATQQAKLSPEVSEAYRGQQYGEEEFGRRMGQAMMPYELEAGFIGDRAKREMTAYSESAQRNLDLILEKIRYNQAVTTAEIEKASALAIAEKQYFDSAFKTIDGKTMLINSRTGEVIQEYGGGSSGGGGNIASDTDAYLNSSTNTGSANILQKSPSAWFKTA